MSEAGGKWLIVGSDGFVGSRLLEIFSEDHPVLGTTRHRDRVGGSKVFLDLETCGEAELSALGEIEVCVFCAMRTSYEACANDEAARHANTVKIPEVVRWFLAQGTRVVFLSSNAVFGGDRPFCDEQAPLTPLFPYAEHKAEAEEVIRDLAREAGAEDRLSILRLTKVLDHTVPPVPEWLDALRSGTDITAFTDFIFAPITPRHIAELIGKIAAAGESGVFHISGKTNLSYFEFAEQLVRMANGTSRVIPTTSKAAGLDLAFLPQYSAIGMDRTAEVLGVFPVQVPDVAASIIDAARRS